MNGQATPVWSHRRILPSLEQARPRTASPCEDTKRHHRTVEKATKMAVEEMMETASKYKMSVPPPGAPSEPASSSRGRLALKDSTRKQHVEHGESSMALVDSVSEASAPAPICFDADASETH